MLNYDINGYGNTVLFGPPPGPLDPRLARTMLETCAAERVDCLRFDGMPPGDDRSFGARKIPAISIAILERASGRHAVPGYTGSAIEKERNLCVHFARN